MTEMVEAINLDSLIDWEDEVICARDECENVAEWASFWKPCFCTSLICDAHKKEREAVGGSLKYAFGYFICAVCERIVWDWGYRPI